MGNKEGFNLGEITKQELSRELIAEIEGRILEGGAVGFNIGVNVKDFGAKGDGVTNDYIAIQDAIETGLPVYVPYTKSGYLIEDTLLTTDGTILYGENLSTSIFQKTDGIPIIRVVGGHYQIYNFHLAYVNQQTESMSGGVGIELGDAEASKGAHEGKISQIIIEKSYRGIGVPVWKGDAFSFMNTFEHIRVLNSWDFSFYLSSREVGLTTNTLTNCYSLFSEDDTRPNGKGFFIGNHDDFIMQNCACDHGSKEALWLEGNRGGTIIDFHAEKCKVYASYFSIVRIVNSKVHFTNLSIPYSIIRLDVTESYLFWIYDGSEVTINNFAERDTTILGTGYFASMVSDATSFLRVDSVKSALPFSFNGKRSIEMRSLQSPSIPTVGNWNVGEIVYNTLPVSGGSIGWVCVTKGDFSTTSKPVFKAFGVIS